METNNLVSEVVWIDISDYLCQFPDNSFKWPVNCTCVCLLCFVLCPVVMFTLRLDCVNDTCWSVVKQNNLLHWFLPSAVPLLRPKDTSRSPKMQLIPYELIHWVAYMFIPLFSYSKVKAMNAISVISLILYIVMV